MLALRAAVTSSDYSIYEKPAQANFPCSNSLSTRMDFYCLQVIMRPWGNMDGMPAFERGTRAFGLSGRLNSPYVLRISTLTTLAMCLLLFD
jgi:hypothetical protein